MTFLFMIPLGLEDLQINPLLIYIATAFSTCGSSKHAHARVTGVRTQHPMVGCNTVRSILLCSRNSDVLVGIDEIGVEIEEPFRLLPLNDLCKEMMLNVVNEMAIPVPPSVVSI